MGDLMTVKDLRVSADVSVADQSDKYIRDDTVIFAVEHPPFITVAPEAEESLSGLNPPKQLVADWNRVVPQMSILDAWVETDYEERYRSHIDMSPAAEKALSKIKMRLMKDDVCIVSGSSMYPLCPRRIIYEIVTGEQLHDTAKVKSRASN